MEKYNSRGKKQARNLLVSTDAVYNLVQNIDGIRLFYSNCIRRRIDITKIEYISVSKSGNMYILHVPSEYDYVMSQGKYRTQILESIVEAYLDKTGGDEYLIYVHDDMDTEGALQKYV